MATHTLSRDTWCYMSDFFIVTSEVINGSFVTVEASQQIIDNIKAEEVNFQNFEADCALRVHLTDET